MKSKIHFDGLGWRDVLAEHAQISWFLLQKNKTLSAAQSSAFWCSLYDSLSERLISLQAYELLSVIKSQVDMVKLAKRRKGMAKRRKFRENQANLLKAEFLHKKMIRQLCGQYCPN